MVAPKTSSIEAERYREQLEQARKRQASASAKAAQALFELIEANLAVYRLLGDPEGAELAKMAELLLSTGRKDENGH